MTLPRSQSDPTMKDWRAAVSAPLTYRIGSSTLHFRLHLVFLSCLLSLAVLLLLSLSLSGSPTRAPLALEEGKQCPASRPVSSRAGRYRLAVVADPDTDSKTREGWQSYLVRGDLLVRGDQVEVTWGQEQVLATNLGAGGRGMEPGPGGGGNTPP